MARTLRTSCFRVDDLAQLNPAFITVPEAEASLHALRQLLAAKPAEASGGAVEARLSALEDAVRRIREENKVCDAERAALRIDINELKARLGAPIGAASTIYDAPPRYNSPPPSAPPEPVSLGLKE